MIEQPETISKVLDDLAVSHRRLAKLVDEFSEADVRAESALPGWTRAHVLTHLAELAAALTRQVTEAMAGRLVDVYDGGRPARAAAIEAGAGRPVGELATAVTTASDRLAAALSTVDDWTRPVRYRDGTLADVALCRWREVELHTTDLAVGYGPDQWSADLCHHVIGMRAERALTLVTPEGTWTVGTGTPVTATGELTDLTASLVGRPHGPVTTSEPWTPEPWG
ncbi:maleylpyruvate isomerase family mycothiol-dependent enzyme [Actinophytocola sp. KF-1]